VTALFMDLKGSAALMEALDPEEARANRLRTRGKGRRRPQAFEGTGSSNSPRSANFIRFFPICIIVLGAR
jgi:hypothetical protein